MLKYLRKYWYWCLLAPIFMLGEIVVDLIQPDMMADIVDLGVLGGNMEVIITVGSKMIILVAFGGICGILSGVFANLASQKFGNDLRKDVFKKIMSLSFQQTDKISTGSLITRLTNDVTQVQHMVMMSVRSVIRCSTMFLGGIYMLYLQSPKFAVVATCGLPIVLCFVTFFIKKAYPLFRIVQKKLDGINNVMQETVAGARVVKAYVKEDYEMARFDAANGELCSINLKVQTLLAFMSPCMNIVLNSCVVAIIYIGGINVKGGGNTTTGEIMAAITYIAQILHGLMFMTNIFQMFTRAGASVTRIREVLDCEDIIKDGEINKTSENGGEIEFKNVSFSYPESSGREIFKNISFKINKGETLAIIGATGSGKTSLVNLIPRFYDVTEGEVLVDNVNVKEYGLEELRNKIAFVLQKSELYSRTIEANIRWGKEGSTPWEIKHAAEVAQADDFICGMKNGYYTQVTEGGHSLSGGQKQRVALSRAVLKDAEILIFDDATSALDLKTEARLYSALKKERPDATKIIVAQRIASIRDANYIAVLEDGEITAFGNHNELLEISETYRDIYNSQLKEGGDTNE